MGLRSPFTIGCGICGRGRLPVKPWLRTEYTRTRRLVYLAYRVCAVCDTKPRETKEIPVQRGLDKP